MDKRKKKYIRLVIDGDDADIIEEEMTKEELFDQLEELTHKVNQMSDILFELLSTAGFSGKSFDIMQDDMRF